MAKQRFSAVLRPSGRGSGGHLIEVPAEVATALGGRGRTAVRATFNGVPYGVPSSAWPGSRWIGVTKAVMENSYSHRRECVGYITQAKKEETRERRVRRTIENLAGNPAERPSGPARRPDGP